MPTLNLTKHTPVSLGTFIEHKKIPNSPVPPSIQAKFSKDNFIIDREGMSFRPGTSNEAVARGSGYHLELHYKAELNRLYVLYMNRNRKQSLYILNL